MNVSTTEIALLSSLYYLLGFGTLAIAGFKSSMIKYIGGYALVTFIVSVWLAQLKWVLLSSIIFMIMASYYFLYAIYGQLKDCSTANKGSNTQEPKGDAHDND